VRKCPKCGSARILRSRSRGVLEQVRKTVSSKRPHRCHDCGWRGWGAETEGPAEPELPSPVRPAPDFKVIDTVLVGVGKSRQPAKAAGRGRHRAGRHGKAKSHL
jgi:hypothetical protein